MITIDWKEKQLNDRSERQQIVCLDFITNKYRGRVLRFLFYSFTRYYGRTNLTHKK